MTPITADVEVIFERHSRLYEVIECDTRGDEALMSKKAFENAVAPIIASLEEARAQVVELQKFLEEKNGEV